MAVITRDLKHKFIGFCKEEFKGKIFIANEASKTQWI